MQIVSPLTGKVDGDTERRAELVISRVALSDGGSRVINSAGDARASHLLGCWRTSRETRQQTSAVVLWTLQFHISTPLTDITEKGSEVLVGRDRNDEALDGRDGGRKRQDLETIQPNVSVLLFLGARTGPAGFGLTFLSASSARCQKLCSRRE